MAELTHVSADGRPNMVDVSEKKVSDRTATARAEVAFPQEVVAGFRDGDISTRKGPVFATAVIAGVMAAKRTHELIPFCHPLGLTGCDINIEMQDGRAIIDCQCKVRHKTGVEMEALTGATVAALTVYDMCKALSHDIRIVNTRLLEKTGGKSDFSAETGA